MGMPQEGRKLKRRLAFGLALPALILVAGCKSSALSKARKEFYSGNYEKADRLLSKKTKTRHNRLLYLVERGVVLHTDGRYEASNKVFLEAAEFARDLETASATRWTASLATNDRAKVYRGEKFERVLIHTYLSMNFLLLENYESALVEAKRVLKQLEENEDAFLGQPFPRYLVALCFELLGEYQDAYIEYQKVYEDVPDFIGLKRELVRMAALLGRGEDLQKWQKLPGPNVSLKDATSEVIFFVQTGKGPEKVSDEMFVPPSHRYTIPTFSSLYSRTRYGIVFHGDKELGRSYQLLDVSIVAQASLDQRLGKAKFKEAIRKGAQEVIALQTDNLLAEVLVRMSFFAISKADTRSWETLPGNFQIVRIRLSPGTYDFTVSFVDSAEQEVKKVRLEAIKVPKERPANLSVRVSE